MRIKRVLAIGLMSAAMGLAAAPAQAATAFYQCGVNAPSGSSCISDTNNVNLTTASGVGNLGLGQSAGVGFVQPIGPGITITTTESQGLNIDASGQATISAVDGILNNLTFNLNSGSYVRAEFNLNDIANADFFVVITSLLNGVTQQTSQTFNAQMNGSNRFGVEALGGATLTGLTISSTNGFGSLTQLRIAPGVVAPAIPEPSTWAMMLLGFGAVGASMRRRRSRQIPQFA
jgi:hypothetical protein